MLREVLDSKLMGRGGAAFPTGRKWDAVARQPRRPHYLVCNADESEPGTFKDRVIMESDPFSLIESMTIAAYATGCEHGYLYLRGEYPLAQRRLENALEQARERGLLGDDILGHGFKFDIELRKGAGAYICGEETAIFGSIEGYRGEPRNKPPFPVERGLFGQPTVVNNVETLVNVLPIVLEGGPGLRRDRHRALDRAQAVLRLRRGRAAGNLRGAVRHHAARAARAGRRPGSRRHPARGPPRRRGRKLRHRRPPRPQADLRGRPRGPHDAGVRRGARARRQGRHPRAADDDRRLHARRELRTVRAVPGRHRAPGGGARPAHLRPHPRAACRTS